VALHVRPTGAQAPARIAVVASRRVGGAVERNRAKRLLREAAQRIDWPDGLDVVLIARAACADSDMTRVHRELEQLLASVSGERHP
jgi:ribonuclease P protein component